MECTTLRPPEPKNTFHGSGAQLTCFGTGCLGVSRETRPDARLLRDLREQFIALQKELNEQVRRVGPGPEWVLVVELGAYVVSMIHHL